jgi:glycerol uptake facilitator protein
MAIAEESWTKKYLGEVLGTFVLVFLGDSFVAYAVAGGSNGFLAGLLGAGMFWGFAVTLAIYAAGAVSGAHLNPAVTLALALRRGFPWSKVPGYIASQVVGAFLAAVATSFVWNGIIVHYENAKKIVRGGANGIESGLIFSANWPHPLLVGYKGDALTQDPWWRGAGTEIIITALLVITILGIIEDRVPSAANVAPLAIGIVVAALVGLFAPIEMASLNPARDFGPRVWELLIGYGSNAIPGPNFNIWITTLMPLIGGPLGAYVYDFIVHQHLPVPVGPDVPEPAPERARARA